MDRKITIAVFVGIFGAGFAIALFIYLGHLIAPVDIPDGFENWSDESQILFMKNLPISHYLSVIIGQGLGILLGVVAGRLLYNKAIMPLYVILVIMLMMSTINYFSMPHPGWFLFADLGFSAIVSIGYIRTLRKA
ncbi:MAG: hypothetical protein HRT57_04345 [Crocinitomicaceae bacterium]|nr:hypothetical protein [Crocinitomicaceae bacterium]